MNSMTGFGRGQFQLAGRTYRIELRSYNHRYLDLKIRLPFASLELEAKLAALIREHVNRGHLEVAIAAESGDPSSGRLELNEPLAQALSFALARLAVLLQCDRATAAHLIPPMRELVAAEGLGGLPTEAAWLEVEPGFRAALGQLLAQRAEEGRALQQDLEQNLAHVEALGRRIQDEAVGEPALHRTRLVSRLSTLVPEGSTLDPGRLAQEVALVADRCDISEELTRLASHGAQLRTLLAEPGAIGRKTEFLLQEFHRELNTIASKTLSAAVGHVAVEAKALVERMREQAQNIE